MLYCLFSANYLYYYNECCTSVKAACKLQFTFTYDVTHHDGSIKAVAPRSIKSCVVLDWLLSNELCAQVPVVEQAKVGEAFQMCEVDQ